MIDVKDAFNGFFFVLSLPLQELVWMRFKATFSF